jgi:transporter family protein
MDVISWRILIIAYILVSGVWGAVAKFASDRLNSPFTMSFVAVTAAWLTIAIFAVPKLQFQSRVGLAAAAVCGFLGGLCVIFFYGALRQGPASLIIPLSSLYIIVTVILSYFFLGESISLRHASGIVLGLVAIFLLIS